MIHLHLSSRFETLLDALAERVRGRRDATGIGAFEPVHVVVPNQGVRMAVHLELARRLGIAANLVFPAPSELATWLLPADERVGVRVAGRGELVRVLLDLLAAGPLLDAPELAPVARYLRPGVDVPGDGLDADAIDRRRVQLARRVASRFEAYGLSRPELLAAWRAGPTLAPEHPAARTEAWQRRLWLEVAARLSAGGWRMEHELLAGPDEPGQLPAELHVVGFTHMEPSRADALARLARRCDVHVYSVAPCAAPSTHPGVERWGRVALEQVTLWRDTSTRLEVPLTAEPRFTDAPATSVLGRLQRGLATPDAWRERDTATRDGSLAVLACPDLWREVEVAASEVWRAVDEAAAAGRTLRFSDVALVIAGRDVDRYRDAIATVFRQAHGIPVSFASAAPGDAERVVEAVRLLVELPLGELGRDELLRLVTHPAIVEAPGQLSRRDDERRAQRLEDAERWLDWSEALMVLRGADRRDHDGTYVERDLFNWDQGVRRLALGALMTGARSRDPRPVALGEDLYAPFELTSDELGPAARFTLLVRSLLADVRFARGGSRPLTTWAELMARLVTSYVVPANDREAELRGRCAGALRALADLDQAVEDARPVSYRVAAELALEVLAGIGPRSHDLADGVVVSTLQPSRPMPFRVVLVLGLNEGEVPRARVDDDLDLCRAERRPGDALPGELDAAAFLERVLGARERLVLSYVARDAQTGQGLAPSSLLRELEHVLVETNLLAAPREALVVKHPLRRYDARYAAAPLGTRELSAAPVLPEAWREAQARALREHLDDHLQRTLPAGAPWPAPGELRRALPAAARERIGALLDDGHAPAPLPSAVDEPVRLSITALTKFLESPLQAWAQHRLRMTQDDEDSDALARRDEPFACDRLTDHAVLATALARGLSSADDRVLVHALEAAHDQVALEAELDGRLPTGVFLDKVRDDHRQALASWAEGFALHLGLTREDILALRPLRLGPAWDHDDGLPADEHEPLRLKVSLEGEEREVVISGRTALLDPGRTRLLKVVSGAPSIRHLLRLFVEALVLAASGLVARPLRLQTVCGQGDPQDDLLAIPDPKEAEAHLRLLVEDLLTGSHDYLLPGDLALPWVRQRLAADADPRAKPPAPLAGSVRYQTSSEYGRTSDRYGPIRHPERFEPPPEAEALAMRRLGPLARWLQPAAAQEEGA